MAATPNFFASTPMFGAAQSNPASTPSLFQPASTLGAGFGATGFGATGFGATNPLQTPTTTPTLGSSFLQPSTSTTPLLGATPTQPAAQAAGPVQLARKDRHPVTYATRIDELDDGSRALLLAVEKQIQRHREGRRQLDSFERLGAGRSLRDDLDVEVDVTSKKVKGLVSLLKADKEGLDAFYRSVLALVRHAEALSNSAQRTQLRHRHLAPAGGPGANAHALATQHGATLPGDLGRPPITPSPFLLETLDRYRETIAQMQRAVAELEHVYLRRSPGGRKVGAGKSDGIAPILQNFTIYFNHVASRYAQVHEGLEGLKRRFAADRKARGEHRDPFAEADRRAAAAEGKLKKQAEQRRQDLASKAQPTPTPTTTPTQPVLLPGTTTPLGGTPATPTLGATPTAGSLFPTTPSPFGAAPSPAFGQAPLATPSPFGGGASFGGPSPFGFAPAASTGGSGKKKSGSKRGK